MYSRTDGLRKLKDVAILEIIDELAQEIEDSVEDLNAKLERAKEEWLPDTYKTHPVVVGAPEGVPVFPIAVYIDGISITRTDNTVAVVVYHVLTGLRRLLCTIRQNEACRCGCRGWCTY